MSLSQQVVERLTPDGVFRELQPFIPSLEAPKDGRVEVLAICPFHDDHRPSWCWNLAKGVATCHVCGKGNTAMAKFIAQCTGRLPIMVLDEYCRRLGLPRPRQRILSLNDYATAKGLPIPFLVDRFSLSDGTDGLSIPYLGRNGEVIAKRIRRRLGEKPRWPRGTPAHQMTYGLHGLVGFEAAEHLVIVEGESDLQTAWLHKLPALGLPGATVGHKAMAQIVAEIGVPTVYAIRDDDLGGQSMIKRLDQALRLAGCRSDLLVVSLPEKDLSDLHTRHPKECRAAIRVSFDHAKPVEDAVAQWAAERKDADQNVGRILEVILATREANPTDKVILLAAVLTVGADLSRPIPMSKSQLAKNARVPRRTFFDRLSGLLQFGLLEEKGEGLYLGQRLCEIRTRSAKSAPPLPSNTEGELGGHEKP